MSRYWELLNHEHELAKASYEGTKDMFDLAIESWDNFIVPVYFKEFSQLSTPLILYKTQADIAIKQAITSVLMKEYVQGIYNVRMAIENLVVAIYAYHQPDKVVELIKQNDKLDKKIRSESMKYVAAEQPEFSEKIKNLHKMCDEFGSHQSFSHMGRHVQIDENVFNVLLVGEDSPELNVGVAGIVLGVMLEFHFVMNKASEVEWVKIDKQIQAKFIDFEKRLAALKVKYLPLFIRLL